MQRAGEPCLDCQSRCPMTCINWFEWPSSLGEQRLHLVIGMADTKKDQPSDKCIHRPGHVSSTHRKEAVPSPPLVECVESNLVLINGKAHLTACDSHPKSSISSLSACLPSNSSGQIMHRMHLYSHAYRNTPPQEPTLQQFNNQISSHHINTQISSLISESGYTVTLLMKSFTNESLSLSETRLALSIMTKINCNPPFSNLVALYQAECSQGVKKGQMVASCCEKLFNRIHFDSFSGAAVTESGLGDKSMSISEQAVVTETQDLNSICKYLPTSDRSNLCQWPDKNIFSSESESMYWQEESGSAGQSESTTASAVRDGVCSRQTTPSSAKRCTVGSLATVRYHLLLFILLICQLHSPVHSSANIRAIEKRILDSIIGDGRYDSRIRPSGNASVGTRGGDGPAMVNVNLLIRSISRIDDVVMEYSVQVTFREEWVDSRLKFDNMNGQIRYLVLTDPNKVWRPDLFFKNEKEGHFHEIIMPNVLLRIYPEGGVLYSIRISLVLACPMDLKYYPLDKQMCSIQMASYGYTTEDLMFIWKDVAPVQITKNLHLPRFTLEKYITDYCTSTTNTGSYSCLKVDLLFKREFSYYLIQIYIPCCMLVIVSWVSFWLDPNAIPARVSLGVTTLLTMATSISGINASLPPVSYTKAIDVWTGVCLTFVFGALLEFALVNYASRSDAHRAALKQQQAAFASQRKWDLEHAAALDADHIDDRSSSFAMRPLVRQHGDFHGEKMRACEIHVTLPKRNWCKRWLSKFPTRSKRIDVVSRIFFPLMFALFNLVYWTTYLFREDMQDIPE